MPYAHITGWGMAVPHKVLTNDDLSKMVDTNDEWIRERTGIRERRIASEHETASSLGVDAAIAALKIARVLPTELDLIICATSSPEYIFPATASLIQDKIGATHAGAFDLLAACSGFVYALHMGAQAIRSGTAKNVLVVGAEALSRFTNYNDRSTCILFGDGAGAFLLQSSEKPGGIMSGVMRSDGSGADSLQIPASGSKNPASDITLHTGMHYIHMDGNEVFRFATRVLAQVTQETLAKTGWKTEDLALVIPHQANIRIIQAAARGLKMPMEKFMVNVDRYGNTSTASIPIATVEAIQQGKLRPGDKTVMVGFGGGLTWGAVAIEWTGTRESTQRLNPAVFTWIAPIRSAARRLRRVIEGIFPGQKD